MHVQHATDTTNLADLLERILDKGIVIAGDIKIKLVEVELLTIQIRLLIASVDKAKEIGIDWWERNPAFSSRAQPELDKNDAAALSERLERLERAVGHAEPVLARQPQPLPMSETRSR
jgi:argonaute-like protein implicated in RNA metabolism and viral defense